MRSRFTRLVLVLTASLVPALGHGEARPARTEVAVWLDEAAEALAGFDADKAMGVLEEARGAGTFLYAEHLRYYELLGVAHVYLERKDQALLAFDMLLALDPGYAISYTLSPKVTFVFEEARRAGRARPRAGVHLSWPSGLKVSSAVPISAQVLADPKGFLAQATLYTRLAGAASFAPHDFKLTRSGSTSTLTLPALDSSVEQDQSLELYLVARDRRGDEVLVVAGPSSPYQIPLTYVKPEPWYRKWWVWSIAAVVVAAGTGVIVGVATYDEPSQVGGSFR